MADSKTIIKPIIIKTSLSGNIDDQLDQIGTKKSIASWITEGNAPLLGNRAVRPISMNLKIDISAVNIISRVVSQIWL